MHTLTTKTANSTEPGTELIMAMAALPAGHPERARLRDDAIAAWLPMAQRLARRYAGRGEPLEDLVQAANEGLIKAVDRFDPSHGVDFPGFAIPTVLGEVKRHFRDRSWAVRMPRRLQEMRMAITEAAAELNQRYDRAPTVAELAVHLGTGEEEVLEGLEGARAYRATSLSTPVGALGDAELGDTLGAEDPDFARSELRLSLTTALAALTERERRIVQMRFYGNQTQSQIATEIGVSQMQVSRLISTALGKLRTRLGPDAY